MSQSSARLASDPLSTEQRRIAERDHNGVPWDLWGSYLSERQWGTVREDYSGDGDAWRSFPHDHARSRVYRWGEDGLLGLCDRQCRLCFSVALWNGVDPILKERPFGLANGEGNHGEDLKDYFFHLANTPTHSFLRALYKYPQQRFPYERLLADNQARGRELPEFELIDTGIFDEDRYFDVVIEVAKAAPDDLAIRYRVINRGPETARLHLLPTLWLRNTWSWGYPDELERPMELDGDAVLAEPGGELGRYELRCREAGPWLFTDNETNRARLYNQPNGRPFQKDGFHRHLIEGDAGAINPAQRGTKVARWLQHDLAPGEEWQVALRLRSSEAAAAGAEPFGAAYEALFEARERDWQVFFNALVPDLSEEDRLILTSAAAGLLWSKKYYGWSVLRWLSGDPTGPAPPAERWRSNRAWQRLHAHDVIAMPDSWEYPYFCQWDLMFHAVAFAVVDPATAKQQCMLLRSPHYTAPNAQTPAYEWALSDPNPPIGAWAAMRIFQIDRKSSDEADLGFLRAALRKLILEYGWWANRNDRSGDNVFEGGFLGLDNIAVVDRRFPLADGSRIEQCDGTAWMASLSLNLLNISVELSREEAEYADICERFIYDFVQLALTLNTPGSRGYVNWDEEDGFYYDVIKHPDGSSDFLRTRSVSGLIPLLAVASFDVDTVKRLPVLDVSQSLAWFLNERTSHGWLVENLGKWCNDRLLFSLVPAERLQRICCRLFDEQEFLSPYGIRALSKVYGEHPYTIHDGDQPQTLAYSPGDSPVAMFGGNSNWRGPVWMPINVLLIESLQKFGHYYGDSLLVEFPTGSGQWFTLWEVSLLLEQRLANLFRRDRQGRRPFQGQVERFQSDPHWCDYLLFHEYFHGDDGRGLGASHQTGWTAMVGKLIQQLHRYPQPTPRPAPPAMGTPATTPL